MCLVFNDLGHGPILNLMEFGPFSYINIYTNLKRCVALVESCGKGFHTNVLQFVLTAIKV